MEEYCYLCIGPDNAFCYKSFNRKITEWLLEGRFPPSVESIKYGITWKEYSERNIDPTIVDQYLEGERIRQGVIYLPTGKKEKIIDILDTKIKHNTVLETPFYDGTSFCWYGAPPTTGVCCNKVRKLFKVKYHS